MIFGGRPEVYRPRAVQRALCAAVLSVLAMSSQAFAQPSAEKAASAQALFDEGLRLMNAGQPAAACPKFAASQKLDPGMGTKFRLAECYEKVGKTASAWALFIEISDEARGAKRPDREKIARKRADDLAPKLARMTVVVAPGSANLAGLEVRRDGTVLEKAVWDVPMPIDPGEHFLTAIAPGKISWESKPVVAVASKSVEVTIPRLKDQPKELVAKAPESVSSDVPVSSEVEKRSLVPGVVLGGIAVVGLGVGGALLGIGLGKKGDANDLRASILSSGGGCVPGFGNLSSKCADLKEQFDTSYMFQNIGGAALGVGGAAAIAAVTYLVWPASKGKKEPHPPLKVAPVTGREQGGFVISGTF